MCATVFCRKLVKGRLYPKAARTGPYAFAQEVSRVRGKVATRYVGIVKVPENASVADERDVVESEAGTVVVENERARVADAAEKEGEANASELRNRGNIP